MGNYKLLILVFITIFCSCQKQIESSDAKNSTNSVQVNPQPTSEKLIANVKTSDTNSVEINEENLCCIDDLKEFLVKELDDNWLTESGEKYHLNQTSKKQILSKLLTIGKKQYALSYDAKGEQLAEEISEVNVTKIITTNENGVTSIRKIYSPSKAEKKLANAQDNVRKSAVNLCKNTNNLELEVEENKTEKVNPQICEDNVQKILLKVHQGAIKQSEEIMQPLRKKNERRF